MFNLYQPGSHVTKIIYDKIIGEQLSRLAELKDPSVIYVTDLVSCTHRFHMRKLYPELSIVFEPTTILGSVAHWGLEELLRSKNMEVEVEVSREVSVGGKIYTIKGRLDALDRSSGLVVEIKTARSAINLPKAHHVKQLNIYLEISNSSEGILVYITPDRVLEYTISREPVNLESEVRDLVNDSYHPRYDWECQYCVYKKLCLYAPYSKKVENTAR